MQLKRTHDKANVNERRWTRCAPFGDAFSEMFIKRRQDISESVTGYKHTFTFTKTLMIRSKNAKNSRITMMDERYFLLTILIETHLPCIGFFIEFTSRIYSILHFGLSLLTKYMHLHVKFLKVKRYHPAKDKVEIKRWYFSINIKIRK